MSDRIERTIDLSASIDRVWRAIADPAEFGAWFNVTIETPFVPGEVARGRFGPPHEALAWQVTIVAMAAPRLFSFTWHPYAIDPAIDYSDEPPTLVEFQLAPLAQGTRLTIVESGFDALPGARRDISLRMNGQGWTIQIERIRRHVDG